MTAKSTVNYIEVDKIINTNLSITWKEFKKKFDGKICSYSFYTRRSLLNGDKASQHENIIKKPKESGVEVIIGRSKKKFRKFYKKIAELILQNPDITFKEVKNSIGKIPITDASFYNFKNKIIKLSSGQDGKRKYTRSSSLLYTTICFIPTSSSISVNEEANKQLQVLIDALADQKIIKNMEKITIMNSNGICGYEIRSYGK